MSAPRMNVEGARPVEPQPAAGLRVAYVMTNYPQLAMSFISGELHELERQGASVLPISMNPVGAGELVTDDDAAEAARTLYLKRHPLRSLLPAAVAVCAAHPLQMASLVVAACRLARFDPVRIARHLVHIAYAADAARYSTARGTYHFHAHFGQSPASIAMYAARIGNMSSPGEYTWSFTIHGYHDFVDESATRLDVKAASASFVACISDFTRSQLLRVADPADWDRVHVIRCGIDLDRFAFRGTRHRSALPRIVVVARLSPEKGHLVLLRALRTLVDRGVDVSLEIIGSGPFDAAIRAECDRLQLAAMVTMSGQLPPDDVVKRLADADVFCLPSFSEGLPVSIMEAMAVGVPVVTTAISGIPELAVNGRTAFTVAPSNAAALAAALERALDDTDARVRMVVAARSAVEEQHALAGNVSRLAGLLRDARQPCSG